VIGLKPGQPRYRVLAADEIAALDLELGALFSEARDTHLERRLALSRQAASQAKPSEISP